MNELANDAEASALLISNVQDYAIFLLDGEGRVVSWNVGAEALYGYGNEEIMGVHFSIFYPEGDREYWPQHFLQLADKEGRSEHDGWRVRKDGTSFWAHVVITPLRHPDGRLRGFANVASDRTERRRYNEALQESEARFRSLIEDVRDYAILTLDVNGNVTSWNSGAREIKGYEADEIIGSNFSCFYTEEDIRRGWPQHELAVAAAQGRLEDENWRVRKDGSRFWASVIITAIKNASGVVVAYSKITRDLTERHRREQALVESAEHLRQHGEALEATLKRTQEFIAMVSHELRSPLAPIQYAASLMESRTVLDPTLERLRQTIERQTALLARIVSDLMDVSRMERGLLSIQREPVSLTNVLSRAIDTARPTIEARAHALETQWSSEPIMVLGDADRLIQVFVNLLNNAARYTDVGGKIRVFVECAGANVTSHVCDTGRGIPPGMLGRVFDPFRQLAPGDSASEGGLGLGLAIVSQIVKMHGGSIEARSEGMGRGSEFLVKLPLMEGAWRREDEPEQLVH